MNIYIDQTKLLYIITLDVSWSRDGEVLEVLSCIRLSNIRVGER